MAPAPTGPTSGERPASTRCRWSRRSPPPGRRPPASWSGPVALYGHVAPGTPRGALTSWRAGRGAEGRGARASGVDVDMTARVGPVALPNPVMTASGTAGHGVELGAYFDLSLLGAVVVKSLSVEPWAGNPAPRLLPVAAGMLNSVGLQNPGVDAWLRGRPARPGQSGGEGGSERVGPERGRLRRGRAAPRPGGSGGPGPSPRRGGGSQHQLPQRRGPGADVLSLHGGDERSRGRASRRPGLRPACRSGPS